MQITLSNEEIEKALKHYVSGQITIASNSDIRITMKAGRGENGFSATVDIVPAGTPQAPHKAAAGPKPAADKQPKPPKEQPAAAAELKAEAAVPTPVADAAEAALSSDEGVASEVEETEEAEAPPADAAPRKSLFGG